MRTLIVDDHALFGEGLRHLLPPAAAGDEAVCCTSGAEAVRLASSTTFDLVLLDWNLGSGLAGPALVQELKAALPAARVVIVSGETGATTIREAIDSGAVGFVPKESSAALLIDAITITAHGGIYLPAAVLAEAAMPRTPRPGMPPATQGPRTPLKRIAQAFPMLTPRHVEVLSCLVLGMSNKQIARELDISDGTVKQHLSAIFRELEVQNRTEAVYLLATNGVRFD